MPEAVADLSDVDAALIARLSSDATLLALMPGGVYWGVAPPEDSAGNPITTFVQVDQVDHDMRDVLTGRTLWEESVYLVKAVAPGPSGSTVKAAAARIHVLLQDWTLEAPGYYPSSYLRRVHRIRALEVDELTDARWQHRGGHYRLLITPRPDGVALAA